MFHVSTNELDVGVTLAPGHWGTRLRGVTTDTPRLERPLVVLFEMALEAARISLNPDLPSRMECIFLAETRAMAVMFRDSFRPDAKIYRVSLLDDIRYHRGDYSLLTYDAPDRPLFDVIPSLARRYWADEPEGMVELIYPGRVLIGEEV